MSKLRWFSIRTRIGSRGNGARTYPKNSYQPRIDILEARICLAGKPFLLVTSYANNSVMRYNQVTGAPAPARGQTGATFVAPGAGGLTTPLTLIFAPDGSLIVDSGEDNVALRYHGRGGLYLNEFVEHNAGGLFIPTGLVFSADHTHFFIASNANNRIIRFDYDGVSAINPITFVSDPDMGGPAGLVFGPDGDLYVSSLNNDKILRYDGTTGAPKPARQQTGATFVPNGSGGIDRCGGVVFGPDGNLYVTSQNTNQVMRFHGKNGRPLPAPGMPGAVFTDSPGSGLDRPAGLLFGPGDDIYVVSINTETVVRVDGDTGVSLGDFITAGSGGLSKPRSLTFERTNPTTLAYDSGRSQETGTQRFAVTVGADANQPAVSPLLQQIAAIQNYPPPVPESTIQVEKALPEYELVSFRTRGSKDGSEHLADTFKNLEVVFNSI